MRSLRGHKANRIQLEEVVVSARRRDESFQNVPITVNVFTAQQIQSAGIENPRDFVAMVPNMTMVEVQNVGNSFITVRGISQARNSEPSVAVLVDGVLETNPYQFNQELTDIQQIEVLKGPQGALYGRNAIGGAIIIHTVDPADHFEGTAKVGIGNGVSERAQVAVSGPIDSAGTLRYRASVNFYNTDGYLREYLPQQEGRSLSGLLRAACGCCGGHPMNGPRTCGYSATAWRRPRTTTSFPATRRRIHSAPSRRAANANNVTSPIQDNNLGVDYRDVLDTALKLDYKADYRHLHLGYRLQHHQGNRYRRCLRFPPGEEFDRLQRVLCGDSRLPWAARSMRASPSSLT